MPLEFFPENPAHEQKILEIIEKEAPGISTSISYHVCRRSKSMNGQAPQLPMLTSKPLTGRYLSKLSGRLSSIGFKGKLFIMLSSGGVTSVETAAEFPVRIIESGPTAAVMAGQYYGKHFNIPEMFCFDMGGTTAEILSHPERGRRCGSHLRSWPGTKIYEGSGLTIQVPVVDLMEIGAREVSQGKQIGHPSGGAGEFRCGTRTYLLRQRRH